MAWTFADDAAFFAAHGVDTSLGTDMAPARERMAAYPNVAAMQLTLWSATARLLGTTLWGQAFDAMEDNPFVKAQYDVSCGHVAVAERVLRILNDLFDPAAADYDEVPPTQLAELKQHVGALFHEMVHAAGPADRERFITERLATNHEPTAQIALESFTDLRVERDLDAFCTLLGLGERAPGMAALPYRLHYPAGVAYARTLLDGLAQMGATTPDLLLQQLTDGGFSLVTLDAVAGASLRRRGAGRSEIAQATARILEGFGFVDEHQHLPVSDGAWRDYCEELGSTAAAAALDDVRTIVARRGVALG